jgi:hypothetical protein
MNDKYSFENLSDYKISLAKPERIAVLSGSIDGRPVSPVITLHDTDDHPLWTEYGGSWISFVRDGLATTGTVVHIEVLRNNYIDRNEHSYAVGDHFIVIGDTDCGEDDLYPGLATSEGMSDAPNIEDCYQEKPFRVIRYLPLKIEVSASGSMVTIRPQFRQQEDAKDV